jgi:amidohydrolase
MLDRARTIAAQLTAWRRHIHQHPETSFQETETARYIADALRSMGIEVQTGVGRTGVVGRLGRGKPVIALRADMDALPIQEETGLPFASQTAGAMHACGHDAHVACLLGAAQLLAETPPTRGEVRFLFQPSEETVDAEDMGGAKRMILDGAAEGIDAVVGLHTWPELLVGTVALSPGPQMAAASKFWVDIEGKGGHGAAPQQTVDPIVLSAHAIVALQTVVSRRLDPVDAGVVTIGTIHAGTQDNIIPERASMTGTIRSLRDEVHAQIQREIQRALGVVRAMGGAFSARFSPGYPVTYNDPELTAFVSRIAGEILGDDAVLPAIPVMKGEDFGILAQDAAGCYVRLGVGFPGEPPHTHHDPHFDLDERARPIGAALLAQTALQYLIR